jgi:hypothetical protein
MPIIKRARKPLLMGFWTAWFPFGIIMVLKIGKESFEEMNPKEVGSITMRME